MFLNPMLLLGTSAIAVPILIHLLNRRKFQRVVWAAMRFVQVSLEKNRRRMRIEDLLLLLLRCVIVALLALALARPTVQNASAYFGRQPVTAIIMLDNSYSMGKSDGLQTRFDMAKQAADEAVAALPKGSSAAILLFSDVIRDVIPHPTSDLNLARDKIRKSTLSDRSTNIFIGLQHAYKTLSTIPGAEKQVYLITDGQALGWHPNKGGNEILRLLQENKDQVATHILLMPDADTRDLAVSNIRLATELPTVSKVLRFEVEVTNQGSAEVRDVPVRLFLDDAPAPAEESIIDVIPPRSAKSTSLHARLRADGYHGITARIASDALPADDSRSLVVRVLKNVQVLLVNGEPGREGREEDAFFLREALQPVGVDLRQTYFIQTRTITASELAQTSLDSYDAIVLANVADIPRPTLTAMERLIGEGRGLIVFPGPNINAGFYRDVLFSQRGILPAMLGEPVGDSNQGERFDTLQSTRFDHPIMNLWNGEGRGNPALAHFFRIYDLKVEPAASQPSTSPAAQPILGRPAIIANYANGKPAIVEHTFGEGRVILFGSTANTQWNDLPVRASIFIPLMHRILDSLLQRQDEHLSIRVGQRFIMRCPGELLGKEAQITRPTQSTDTDPAPPDIARVELSDSYPELTYDRTELGGIYKVALEGQEPTLFAAQPDPAESDLTPLTPEEISQFGQSAEIITWKPGSAAQSAAAAASAGTELWRPLAAALLAIAALETLLAFWFSRVK